MTRIADHPWTTPGADLLDARRAVVIEHVDAEARRDVEGSLATFARPRYELPGDEVLDGVDAVTAHYRQLFGGFPDLAFPPIGAGTELHHASDSVVMVTRMVGTHSGSLGGLPPTSRRIDVPVVALFDFEGADLVCERVIFDRLTLLTQLGLARDPRTAVGRAALMLNHPFALARGAVRAVLSRRAPVQKRA
jgi:predicted ester cyclase